MATLLKYIFKAMRPHQWLKNSFILLPLVFGQQLFNMGPLLNTFYILIFFSLVSSSIYMLNDIIDIDEDRQHPEKSKRPLASGKLTTTQAKIAAFVLLAISLPGSFLVNPYAGIVVLLYIFLNYLYSQYLKHAVIIDVFCIGAFFYLRILLGSITGDVALSNWIVICTFLLALFLGFNKRRYDIEFSKKTRPVFSKYNKYFIDRMISVISSSIVVTYALYAMDPATRERFGTDHLIISIPFVYYGIFRYLYLMDMKWFGGDPANVLVRDYKMIINMSLWLSVSIGVIYFKL